jgi:hypothetical protein
MKRRSLLVGYGLAVLGAVGVFQMKYQIETKERLFRQLQQQYLSDQKSLRVLEAEWAYLNSPASLQELTGKYLELGPVPPNRILVSPSLLPWRDPDAGRIKPRPDKVRSPPPGSVARIGKTTPTKDLTPLVIEHEQLRMGDDG